MLLKIDHSAKQPLHEQLAGQMRAAIVSGELKPGDKLPPARELASGLDVNVHTLLRALKTLKEEGLVDMRRGRGTAITAAAPRVGRLAELADELVDEAKRSGMSKQQVLSLVEAKL